MGLRGACQRAAPLSLLYVYIYTYS
jgi:hypothetical protein